MTKYEETMQIIQGVRQKTDTAVLFYSAGGKDGIALLDMLSPVFKKVICYYMWLVPGLDHVKPYLAWAIKKYPNVEIRQIKHYQRDYYDKYGFFQFGEGNPDIKPRKVGEVEEMVRQETDIKWAFSGMKGVDGYMKRMRLLTFKKRNGTYITEKGMVYPLAIWTNKEVLKYIEMRNLIKPFVYNPKDVWICAPCLSCVKDSHGIISARCASSHSARNLSLTTKTASCLMVRRKKSLKSSSV